jgi:hypothetical protein
MEPQTRVERILRDLTPARLREVIHDLAKQRRLDDRSTVPMTDLLDAVGGGEALGSGGAAWSATLRLKRALVAMLGEIPGLQYVEGDA